MGLTRTSAVVALTLSAGAVFAEAVEITQADGVTWNSYTASTQCIQAVVEHALGEGAEIFVRNDSIGGIAYPDNTTSEFIINFQSFSEVGHNPVVESITHHFNHDYRPNPELGFENYSYAGRGGVMSYEPQSLEMGVVKQPDENWSPQMHSVDLINGDFAENGYGESDYDAMAVIFDIDQRLRACDLSM